MRLSLLAILLCLSAAASAREIAPIWPLENNLFWKQASYEAYLQPTASGKLESGLYGCVRSGGNQFHEGIDLRAQFHDKKGEATDAVVCVFPGVVAYINAVPGNSSYGRYVVVVHEVEPSVFSLYAHLGSVSEQIKVGQRVGAGSVLGVVGRSAAGYIIPKTRAHLHFELGLRLTDNFDAWYQSQNYSNKNKHGIWNGMNLEGFDPLPLYEQVRSGTYQGMAAYIQSLPTAFELEVVTRSIPNFIDRYPALLTRPIPRNGIQGWRIAFTAYGLPKSWTPLDDTIASKQGSVTLLRFDPELLGKTPCKKTIIIGKNDNYRLGSDLRKTLALLFD
jgi:murein DD-endopeptidase MepM/ murein hydrolase activator NlpD